jgi:hypothetical protein
MNHSPLKKITPEGAVKDRVFWFFCSGFVKFNDQWFTKWLIDWLLQSKFGYKPQKQP